MPTLFRRSSSSSSSSKTGAATPASPGAVGRATPPLPPTSPSPSRSLLGVRKSSSGAGNAASKMAATASGAQAYLAAFAAKATSSNKSMLSPSKQHHKDYLDGASVYGDYDSASIASTDTSSSIFSRASSIASSVTSVSSSGSSSSLLRRHKDKENGVSLSIVGEETVRSNDYGIEMPRREAELHLSKDPPKDASKLLPARHFDRDPHFVPPALRNDRHALKHAEFGYQEEPFEYTSRFREHTGTGGEEIEEPSMLVYLTTYMSYLMLIVVGHIRDFIGKRTHRKSYQHLMPYDGYAALNSDFDSFYTRRLKARIEDLFARPVTGVAGRTITCLDRITADHYATFRFTGLTTQALNISSYNYLGFNQSRGGCADAVEEIIRQYGVSALGNREVSGTLDLHVHTERLLARFLGVEDALLISQGFATNSATLPTLVSKGCLVISDEFNHSSIRFGVRLSGATVRQYKHNDMKALETLLRDSISQGQPRTHRPWKKILLVVEGLYSMEGTLVDLPRIMQLKELYKFYLYVDEAHSIGAMGPRGRGVCDYFGINPNAVDIMMGTLTKSFGAAGGYIGGSAAMISMLRKTNHSNVYGEAHSPAVLVQIMAAIISIMGEEATDLIPPFLRTLPTKMLDGSEGLSRLRRLAFNSRYLSTGLRKLGFIVYGHRDSPIVPLLMFSPGKMGTFSRLMLEKFNIVVVVVAYPATPLVSSRVRFCTSAAHTKEDIDRVLIACDIVGDVLGLKLCTHGTRMSIADIIANARNLVESD